MSPTRPPIGYSRRDLNLIRESCPRCEPLNLENVKMNENQERQLIKNQAATWMHKWLVYEIADEISMKEMTSRDENNRLASEMSRVQLMLAGAKSTLERLPTETTGHDIRTLARLDCIRPHQHHLKLERKMTNRRRQGFERMFVLNSAISTLVAISTRNRPPVVALTSCLLASVALLAILGDLVHGHEQLSPVGEPTQQINKLQQASFQQLIKSADVELKRRSLQRSQREAVQTSTHLNGTELISGQQHAATCGYPGSPAHASVTFNTSHVVAGTAASYTCDNGYELLGPPRRICQANGTWAPVGIPFCVLNVGLGKAAMQSSTAGGGSAQKAVDGSTSPYFQAGTCTMTDVENNPWWYVNLLEPYLVQIVRIDFGTACCANRQKATIAVRVGNNRPDLGTNPLCNRYHGYIEEGKPLFLPCTRPAPGAFVSIHLESPSGSALSICETFIYTDHALSIEQCPSFRDQPLGSTATYNGKCYLFHNNQALAFESARKYCDSRGGTLVDETSPALQGFLSWELYRRHRNDQLMGQYWLGAVRDARNSQNWKWISGRDVQISFWNSLTTGPGGGNCSRFDGSKGWLWSDTDCAAQLNFICQYRPLSCGKPEKPTNSTLITKNIDNGTVIEYQCAPGNLLMGPKSRVCLPTGFFSEFAPKCKYLDCQPPAMIANGDYKLLNSTTSYQSLVTYYCNEGYQLYARSTLTCDVDERWNGPPPRCEPLLCPAPVAPSNGYVTVTSNITIPGTQATYDCRPGYELVGDRLMSCLNSGSWDQSFPYCREKRQLSPHTLNAPTASDGGVGGGGQPPAQQQAGANQAARQPQVADVISSTMPPPPPPPSSNSRTQPQQPAPAPAKPASNVHFPASGSAPSPTAFSSNRVVPPPPTSSSSAANLPASLNGLAGGLNQAAPAANQTPQLPVAPSTQNEIQLSTGGGGDSAAQPPMPSSRRPPPPPPPTGQQQQQQQQPGAPSSIDLARQQVPARGPQSGSSLSSAVMLPPPLSATLRPQTPASSVSVATPNNKFTFGPVHQQPTSPINVLMPGPASTPATSSTTGAQAGQYGGDPSTLATINLISVSGHHGGHNHHHQPSGSSEAPSSPASSSGSPFAHSTASTPGAHPHSHHQHQHQNQASMASSSSSSSTSSTTSTSAFGLQQQSLPPPLLASPPPPPPPLPPVRASSHNSLANNRNSLDGIIAMAIIGSILFLGTVITILVIIVRRRKSAHSSTIDAQTISTYDSNGHEQNGLYRNYQQAWENLRFSAPGSQPKSSGIAPGAPGPAMGLKNYAPAMLHHAHPVHTGGVAPGAVASGGRHNLGMSSSSTTSSSSHHSSSSLGITGPAGSGGADPLLGPNYLGHQHHNPQMSAHHIGPQHHHCVVNRNEDDDDEDDDDNDNDDYCEDEHGVISADETANYHQAHHHAHHHGHQNQHQHMHAAFGGRSHRRTMSGAAHHLNEGFRDSNELTINAEMAPVGAGQQARLRLYSTNSMSRSVAAAVAANRRSTGNLAAGAASAHSNGGHQAAGSAANRTSTSSSNTTSNSTHSSRASPPSGQEDELDRLAYGNNWQQHQQHLR